MLNLTNTFKQTSIYTLGIFLTRGINILLLPVYTRYLNPSDYGTIDILTIFSTLINLTIALEIHQAIARFYSEWGVQERVINISTALYFTLIIYTVFVLLLFPFGQVMLSSLLDGNASGQLYPFITMIWTSGVFYFTQSQLRWQLLAVKHNIVSLLFTVATALCTVVLVKYSGLGVGGVMWGLTAGNTIGIFSALYFTRKSYVLCFKLSALREMLKFSSPLVLSSIAVFLSLFVDRVLIKELLSLEELGLFGVAVRFASIVGILLTGLNNALTPLIYTYHKEEKTPFAIERIFRAFVYGAVVFFTILSAFAEEMVMIFTSADYHESYRLIPLIILTTLFSSVYNFTPGLFIKNKTKVISIINLLVSVLNIIFNLFLLPKIGLVGAPISTLMAFLVGIGFYYYFGQKYYPIPYKFNGILIAGIMAIVLIFAIFFIPVEAVVLKYLIKCLVVSGIMVTVYLLAKREELFLFSGILNRFVKG